MTESTGAIGEEKCGYQGCRAVIIFRSIATDYPALSGCARSQIPGRFINESYTVGC